MVHSPCFYLPLPAPLFSPLYPLLLTWNPPSCDRNRPPRSQVACKLTSLVPPFPQTLPPPNSQNPNCPAPHYDDLRNNPVSSVRNTARNGPPRRDSIAGLSRQDYLLSFSASLLLFSLSFLLSFSSSLSFSLLLSSLSLSLFLSFSLSLSLSLYLSLFPSLSLFTLFSSLSLSFSLPHRICAKC